eukprot:12553057-Ditylum_brightwellii.AAC.1
MSKSDKYFVISKAAIAKQVIISTAVFGCSTDFFCKDETVQRNGGVHVIQSFLSEEESEEIQIQGRTARQGRKGSNQMILLPISSAHQKHLEVIYEKIEENLANATEKILQYSWLF